MNDLLRLFATVCMVILLVGLTRQWLVSDRDLTPIVDFARLLWQEQAAESPENAASPFLEPNPTPAPPAATTRASSWENAVHRTVSEIEAGAPTFEEMYRDRSRWPHSVLLATRVNVPVYDEGRYAGWVGLPPGKRLELERMDPDGTLMLASQTLRFEVDFSQTNLLNQVVLDRRGELEWLRWIDQQRILLARERSANAAQEETVLLAESTAPVEPQEAGDPVPETAWTPRELAQFWRSYADFE